MAEETGLSISIGEWVLYEACRKAAGWTGMSVSVNVSPRQVSQGDLVPLTKQVLTATGLDPRRLCLEITEQLLLEHSESNIASIDGLKKLGIPIALDDFGVGYSSLGYIRRFHPSKIKIDCSLIQHVATSQEDAALVHAAISRRMACASRWSRRAWSTMTSAPSCRPKDVTWRKASSMPCRCQPRCFTHG